MWIWYIGYRRALSVSASLSSSWTPGMAQTALLGEERQTMCDMSEDCEGNLNSKFHYLNQEWYTSTYAAVRYKSRAEIDWRVNTLRFELCTHGPDVPFVRLPP